MQLEVFLNELKEPIIALVCYHLFSYNGVLL